MFDEYVGNHDGRAAERLAAILHDVVRGRTVSQIDAAPVVEKAAGRAAA